jgi:DNA-binding transcriptional LysR family regulator
MSCTQGINSQVKGFAMELDQLRYFLRVARRSNFTRAAEDLGISQPALSRSIQKLEEELGQPVFERKTRSVSLSHGVSMIPAMARVLDQSDRRVYRSLSGRKPTRKIAVVWNPYRFQSRLLEAFRERIRRYSVA